jgi:two-component system response regulator QseB
MSLLLVEDDTILGDGLCVALTAAGHTVDWVQDGYAAEHALDDNTYWLVILDLQLPGRSGLEVLTQLRRRGNPVPVLITTSFAQVEDRVAGLNKGADDYLVKPFDLDELLARINALERRAQGRVTPVLGSGSIVLDPNSHHVTVGERPVALSRHEFLILQALLENAGRVLPRERLEQLLYGWGDEPSSNTLEVHIHHLRRKLDVDVIRTVRGVGYMLERRKTAR